jgi:hypothetical protein
MANSGGAGLGHLGLTARAMSRGEGSCRSTSKSPSARARRGVGPRVLSRSRKFFFACNSRALRRCGPAAGRRRAHGRGLRPPGEALGESSSEGGSGVARAESVSASRGHGSPRVDVGSRRALWRCCVSAPCRRFQDGQGRSFGGLSILNGNTGAHSHLRCRKYQNWTAAMVIATPSTSHRPQSCSAKGMPPTFMPKRPVRKVSGRNVVETRLRA